MANEVVKVTEVTNVITASLNDGSFNLLAGGTIGGNLQLGGTLTVGENDLGHDVKFFGATSGKYLQWDESADKLIIAGDLDVTGTTTSFNSTVVTIDDPVFTIGGDTAPSSDDNKDRGIEFRYHDGSNPKVGFFGYDDSTSAFTFLTAATNSSEVFSGTAGNLIAGDITANAVTLAGNLSAVNIAGTLTTAAQTNITSLGTLTALTVDDITINGSTIFDAGDLTVDVGGDISLDADGGNVYVKDAGTTIGQFFNDNSNFVVKSEVNDKDLVFKGVDNSVNITALTLDMSAAGAATFNDKVVATQLQIVNATPNIQLYDSDTANQFNIDFNGADATFKAATSDGDIIFQADNGSGGLDTYLRIDGGAHTLDVFKQTHFYDSVKATFGTGNDLEIYHDGSHSWIEDTGQGDLYIKGSDDVYIMAGSDIAINCNDNAEVSLWHNNSKKFETTSAGASVTGSLGIGTTAPVSKLTVESSANALADVDEPENHHLLLRNPANDTTEGVGMGFLVSSLTDDVGASIICKRTDTNAKSELQFWNKQNTTTDGVITQAMTIADSGNVGIGSTSPVSITTNARSLTLNGTHSTVGGGIVYQVNGATKAYHYVESDFLRHQAVSGVGHLFYANAAIAMRIESDGDVGIGTTPSAFLHVSKDNSNSGNQFCVADLEGTNAAVRTYTHGGDAQGLILNHYYAVGGSSNEYMRYADLVANVGNGAGTTMRFITKNAANNYSTTVIDNEGNVGIGATPQSKLHVTAGDIRIDNNQQYLAETAGGGTIGVAKMDGSDNLLIGDGNLKIDVTGTSPRLIIDSTGAVELFHNNSKKFETTADGVTITGDALVEDNLYLTDAGTVRGKIQLNSSDRDNLDIKAISLGSLMRFYTVDTLALTLDASQTATFAGDVVVTGGLTINGTTTTIDTANLAVEDKNIIIGNVSSPSDTTADGGGITLKGASDYTINWLNSNNSWNFNQGIVVGQDDTGHDVKFFGATTGFYLHWDESANALTGYYDLKLADEREIQLGATNDLRLYHSAGNNFIKANSGDLTIQSDNDDLKLLAEDDIVLRDNDDSTNFIHCVNGGPVRLYHNGSQRLETTASGVTISGLSLELFHSGGNNYISSAASGSHLLIRNTGGANVELLVNTSEKGVIAIPNGAVQLYHDNGHRLSTTVDGISLHGNGYIDLPDNGRARFGGGFDLAIYHNTHSYIESSTNHLYINNKAADGKTVFKADDGGGSAQTEFFRIDGGSLTNVFSKPVHVGVSGTANDFTAFGSTSARYMMWDGSADLLNFMDSVKITLGNSNDLQLYHSGSHSYIRDEGDGGLYLQTNGPAIYFQDTDGNAMAQFTDGGACFLMHNGSTKFQTSATGATMGGNLVMGTNHLMFADNGRVKLGDSNDLQIWHAGSYSYIDDSSGNLQIYQNVDNGMIRFFSDNGTGGTAEYLRIDGSAEQVIYSRDLTLTDGLDANFGTDNDLQLKHDGSNSYINQTGTGDLHIRQTIADQHIFLSADNGSGTATTYIQLDGGNVRTKFAKPVFMQTGQQIYLHSTGTYISHDGTNHYLINGTGDTTIQNDTTDGDIKFKADSGSGSSTTEYFRLDGGDVQTKFLKDLKLEDSVVLQVGTGNDLQAYHDGSNSYVTNATGDMYFINSADDKDITFMADDGSGGFETYFFLDGSLSSGEPLTVFPDDSHLRFGNDADFGIVHSTHSYLNNSTGDLYISQHANGKDIILRGDDGSGGITTYLQCRGDREVVQHHRGVEYNVQSPNNTDYTVGSTDYCIIMHSLTQSRTVTIPTAQRNAGRVLIIKERDGYASSYNVVIDPEGSTTIDGSATYTISTNKEAVTLISDGSNWFIIGKS